MLNLPLPQRMFCKGGEPDQRKKVNFYFVLKYLGTFRYLLEHGGDVAFSVQFAHFMLSRQLVMEKKHEIWMQFGGAPIRFSIQDTYWEDLIGNDLGEIDDEWIVKKLNSKNFKDPRKKLQLCCLLLVDALMCPRNLDRKISEVHVKLVRDVEKFLNYPWGREAFSLAMKSIKTRGAEGLCQKTLAIQGFLHGMQLAMLKCIPHIKTRATYTPGAKKKKKGSTYATTSDEEVEVDDNTMEGSEDDFKFDDEAVDTKVDNLLERIVNGPAFTIRCWSGGKHFNDVPPSVRQAKRKSATASGTGTTDEMHVVAEEIA
ncbi:hypothetical protein N665_3356s0001, partial [Sinapis alba]